MTMKLRNLNACVHILPQSPTERKSKKNDFILENEEISILFLSQKGPICSVLERKACRCSLYEKTVAFGPFQSSKTKKKVKYKTFQKMSLRKSRRQIEEVGGSNQENKEEIRSSANPEIISEIFKDCGRVSISGAEFYLQHPFSRRGSIQVKKRAISLYLNSAEWRKGGPIFIKDIRINPYF